MDEAPNIEPGARGKLRYDKDRRTIISEPMVRILLSKKNAELLAQNIDGWSDAGACEGGLTPDERKALDSAYDQIMRQIIKPRGSR